MKFPFVSRERLEEKDKQLNEANAERIRLLDILIETATSNGPRMDYTHPPQLREVAVEAPEVGEANAAVQGFTTPFDRIGARFDQARASGGNFRQYRARA